MYHLANDIVPDSQYDRRKLIDQNRDQKIKDLTGQLTNGTISSASFLNAMATDQDESIYSEYECEEESEEESEEEMSEK